MKDTLLNELDSQIISRDYAILCIFRLIFFKMVLNFSKKPAELVLERKKKTLTKSGVNIYSLYNKRRLLNA